LDDIWFPVRADGTATCEFLLKAKETKMSEINETFTQRVDVTTQPDGAFIGTLEIDVRHGDLQQDRIAALLDEITALRAEVLALRNHVREMEGVLNGLD
jgi:hypothetical protein